MTLLAGHTMQASSPPAVVTLYVPAGQVSGTGRLNNIIIMVGQLNSIYKTCTSILNCIIINIQSLGVVEYRGIHQDQ